MVRMIISQTVELPLHTVWYLVTYLFDWPFLTIARNNNINNNTKVSKTHKKTMSVSLFMKKREGNCPSNL